LLRDHLIGVNGGLKPLEGGDEHGQSLEAAEAAEVALGIFRSGSGCGTVEFVVDSERRKLAKTKVDHRQCLFQALAGLPAAVASPFRSSHVASARRRRRATSALVPSVITKIRPLGIDLPGSSARRDAKQATHRVHPKRDFGWP
jgi:hypothetical protein